MGFLQVAVGVIKNREGKILISLRHAQLHQGGLWEFPGGKVEAAETPELALARELKEELDIVVTDVTPLITINHQYPDLAVRLNVFTVNQFLNVARSCEGQPIKWVAPAELGHYAFPAANRPIITAARLPQFYAILDDADEAMLLSNLQKILDKGIKLIQARLKNLPVDAVAKFVGEAYPLCKKQQAVLLMNSAVSYPAKVDGIHLTSHHLMALSARPENCNWLAASCHNLEQLQHAQNIGVDFAVLAPILPTQTHPCTEPLGWEQFTGLAAKANLPVYALGGMALHCLATAQRCGGQGIAAIRAFLD